MMTISDEGTKLLQSIEKLALTPYDDQTGQPTSCWVKGATIGYGHLICQADWPIYQAGITEEAADRLFLDDLKPFIRAINTRVTSKMEQHEFDALVILTFNIGTGNFASSSVLKLVNDPNAHTAYPDLEAAWKAWNKSQGKVSNGLIHRRAAEWDIYCRCSYHTW